MIPMKAALEQVAWADDRFFAFVEGLPVEAWRSKAAPDEWDVTGLMFHLVASADWFGYQLGGPLRFTRDPDSIDEVRALRPVWQEIDAFLVAQADRDDGAVTYEEDGRTHAVLRSTVLTEVIIHAVEHRAQAAAALKAGGHPSPELQDLSVWPFAESEVRG